MVLPIIEAECPLNDDTEITNDDETKENRERRFRRGKFRQIAACLIANTSILGPAMALGYSAVALGPLGSENSEIKATPDELSWIASITAIATPIGCILSGLSMRRGRRFGITLISVISVIGWIAIYLSRDVNHILIGRAISGIAIGLASVPATVYAAEISAPELRGIVVTWTSVSIAIGILFVYIFGFIFQTNWRLVALLCGLFPIISMILVITKMPESHVWLLSVDRNNEAKKTLRIFQGFTNDEEIETLNFSTSSNDRLAKNSESIERDYNSKKTRLLARENIIPLLIMLGYFFFQQFSGIFVVVYYAVDFTVEAGVQIDGHLAAILIGITRILGTILVSYVSRRYGRRIPSIGSGVGMTIFMGILSSYLWSKSMGYELNDHGIIPVFSLLMYIVTSTMGFLVLPFAMIGELYPAKVKDVLSGLTTCFAYIFSFVVLKIYPDMLKAFNKHGVFLFYGIMSLLGTIFVYRFLPETKGKTLQQIEESFKNFQNSNNKINNDERKEELRSTMEEQIS